MTLREPQGRPAAKGSALREPQGTALREPQGPTAKGSTELAVSATDLGKIFAHKTGDVVALTGQRQHLLDDVGGPASRQLRRPRQRARLGLDELDRQIAAQRADQAVEIHRRVAVTEAQLVGVIAQHASQHRTRAATRAGKSSTTTSPRSGDRRGGVR